MPRTLYMVVEHFNNKDAVAVCRRFRDSGRLAPEGLLYVPSWVDDKLERCYQLMESMTVYYPMRKRRFPRVFTVPLLIFAFTRRENRPCQH
jgi:hypothetical protein